MTDGVQSPFPKGFGLEWEGYTGNDTSYLPGEDGCCKDQARIKITPPCWARSLKIEETSFNSQGWTFNLGDSPSNNGWGKLFWIHLFVNQPS